MASVLYMHFDGELVAEDRGGTVSHYVSDTLGSTMAIVDSTGFITDQFEYWPYGEELSRTGSNPTPFTWVGTLGYFKDAAARFYVRMRSYLASAGSWMRVDPLWPGESAYAYANSSPTTGSDKLGLSIILGGCLVSGGFSLVSNLFTMGIGKPLSPQDIICNALSACLKGAFMAWIYEIGVGFLLGCLAGLIAGIVGNLIADLCKCYSTPGRSKCTNCGITPCDLGSAIASAGLGCVIGGAKGDSVADKIIAKMLNWLYGLVNAAWGVTCSKSDQNQGGFTWPMPK